MEERKVKTKYGCTFCTVNSSSFASLLEHVLGNKHRIRLKRVCPEMVPHIRSLQNFLDVYMKDDTLLGLEYVVEVQGDQYKCTCQLCNVDFSTRQNIITHLLSPVHLKKYVDKHHPAELTSIYFKLSEQSKVKAIRAAALSVQTKHGRQKMKSIASSHCGDTIPAKVAKYTDTKESSGSHSSGNPVSSRQSASIANPLVPVKASQVELYKKLKFLQFKQSADFMNYLREFEIRNDEDAKFMDKITKNCSKALLEFQKEQINTEFSRRTPAHSLQIPVHAKGTDQESDSHVLETVDKIDSCLSRCEAELSGATATPVSLPVEKTDATEVFFSSIRNMEESEVISVFKNIAATNLAFKGINIPNVMQYLQETGRLKKT